MIPYDKLFPNVLTLLPGEYFLNRLVRCTVNHDLDLNICSECIFNIFFTFNKVYIRIGEEGRSFLNTRNLFSNKLYFIHVSTINKLGYITF